MQLFDTLYALFASNPILTGGVGTVVAGSVMYVLRAIPERILAAVNRALWTDLTVESFSNEYRDVDGFIEKRRIKFFSRSLEIKDGAIKTGFGSGWGIYRGTLFKYTKAKASQQNFNNLETITVAFLTRDRGIAELFVRESCPDDYHNSINVTMYAGDRVLGGLRRRKRGLSTVFVDKGVKDRLVNRLTWFTSAEDWHVSRGIPWKLGIILHGPPGTGKTSLIHALASDFGLNIIYIKSLHGLGAAFSSASRTDIVVIEDIDTISGGLTREGSSNVTEIGAAAASSEPRMTGSPLHEILNAMDGMQTPDGLKFIVTTNHLAKLDPAIVRPGRIDDVIEVGPLSLESAREMFKAFYGRDGIVAAGYTPRTGAVLQQMFSTMTAEAAEAELARLKIVAVTPIVDKLAG